MNQRNTEFLSAFRRQVLALDQDGISLPSRAKLVLVNDQRLVLALGERVKDNDRRSAIRSLRGAKNDDPIAVREPEQNRICLTHPEENAPIELRGLRAQARLLRHPQQEVH